MSFYNHEYDVLFIHVPKTAGTSMERAYFIGGGGHQTIRDFEIGEDTFTFSFVRNPWDRFVSGVVCQHKYIQATKEQFTQFVMDECSNGEFPKNGVVAMHFLPQYHFLLENYDKIGVDFVGHFENLECDWRRVCSTIVRQTVDLEHHRKVAHNPYRYYYTPESWDIIGNLYQRDVELFGYGRDYLNA